MSEREHDRLVGQRRINLIWEFTQSFIAGGVVLANILAAFERFHVSVTGAERLWGAALLIIGFYFGRTNHTRPNGQRERPTPKGAT